MPDTKLFRLDQNQEYCEIPGQDVRLEKELQSRIEANMDTLLGVRFLASEYSTGREHGGRIDSLGLDENNCPVILEYKRSTGESVINQGLFYLDWLMNHQAQFQLLVQTKLGAKVAEQLDWSSPRLLCIAGGFTRYDEYAVKQIDRNIDLLRYTSFGPDLLMLELVNASTASIAKPNPDKQGKRKTAVGYKTVSDTILQLDKERTQLLGDLRNLLQTFGDDVQEKTLQLYLAFKRIRNFVCVEVKPSKGVLTLYLRLNPDDFQAEEGFSRDVRNIGHWGSGDLEITLATQADLIRAEPLLRASYANS